MDVRLVVSGEDERGKSVFVSDEVLTADAEFGVIRAWGADAPPSFPMRGRREEGPGFFPPLGGYRFIVFSMPAGYGLSRATPEVTGAGRLGEGLDGVLEPGGGGMHTTDTVDLEVVLSGEASLELDDGATVHLKAGDCFVQNGTRHRWFNRGDVETVVVACVIGGAPRR